jgi:hypothetical protein
METEQMSIFLIEYDKGSKEVQEIFRELGIGMLHDTESLDGTELFRLAIEITTNLANTVTVIAGIGALLGAIKRAHKVANKRTNDKKAMFRVYKDGDLVVNLSMPEEDADKWINSFKTNN